MKTYYFSSAKSISIFSIMGLLSVVMASCGSYKNSSYYDGDGIYGGSEVKKADTQTQTAANENSQYKDYFSSLQKDESVEVFTDVESYNSTESTNTATEGGYSGWGNNPEHVTVNVYDSGWAWNGWNNYFYGPSYGWGIGYNSWYGPSFGWGWNNYWYGQSYYPYYGWGWNNYYNGYYNPYYYGYGYNHYYPHNHGVRGSSYRGDRYESGNRYQSGRRNAGTRNANYTPGRPRTNIGGTRTPNYNNPPRRGEVSTPRNYNSNPRNNSSTPRSYTPTRSETSTPRSNPRSESSSPRNYSSGSGSNSSSGGSYGGGRSGGGGRR